MKACKKIILLISALFPAFLIYPQESNFSSPQMPTISSPTIGQGFYVPQVPQYYKMPENTKKASANVNSSSNKNSSAQNLKNPSISILQNLTANDLNSLSTLGLLDEFNILNASNSSSTQGLLTDVLNELQQIKTNQLKAQVQQTIKPVQNLPKPQEAKHKKRILRFTINNYNVLGTCQNIFISNIQKDGSFLITGDRKYLSDKKNRSETFHLLFKSLPSEKGALNYSALSSVNQDYLNEYSFLYQLTKRNDLKITRTGNFLAMHTDDPSWKLDFLMDLGE